MSMHKTIILLVLSFGWGSASSAEGQKFGQPVAPNDFAAWDISIGPDGVGLPAGSGTPTQGAAIYAQKCVTCHGEQGAGGPGGALVGGGPLSGGDRDPAKLIGNYWPYATTIFDFTRRAMPLGAAEVAHQRRSLRSNRLCARAQQDHRRERCDERGDAAEGAHAQPGRIHSIIPEQALNSVGVRSR